MVKPSKLYAQLIQASNRSVAYRDFEKLLGAFGFTLDRTSGSHAIYIHPLIPRPFPVQPDGKDAKRYQVREFLELVEQYSLYIDE